MEDLTDVAQMARIAERIIWELREPFEIEGQKVLISTSVGVCLNASGYSPEDLLRNADTVMYRAKRRGKANYEVFDPEASGPAINQ